MSNINLLVCCCISFMLVCNVGGLKILMASIPLKGHLTPVMNLGEELQNKGHSVTLVSLSWPGLQESVTEKGMTFINAGAFPFEKEELQSIYQKGMEWDIEALVSMFSMQITPIIEYMAAAEGFDFTNWDVIVAGDFLANAISCLAKSQAARDGSVVIVSVVPRQSLVMSYLNRSPWSTPTLSPLELLITEQMNFWQRLVITLQSILHDYVLEAKLWESVYPAFIRDMCIQTMYTHVNDGHEHPVLISSVVGFEFSRMYTPLTHYVGPIYPKKTLEIPNDLNKWLDSKGSKQCILISMGSMAAISDTFVNQIIQSISLTNYSVVWSLKKHHQLLSGIQYDTNRLFVSEWIPQFAVMGHKCIALAILHGGLGGINDALYNAIPIVCMPFGGDQTGTCLRVQELGLGIMILDSHSSKSSTVIANSIQTILTNYTMYSKNAARFRKLLQSGGGVDRAVELIELYASVGYDHLIPAYVKYDWSWVAYCNIDVQITIALILCLVIIGIRYCCDKCNCCCRKHF